MLDLIIRQGGLEDTSVIVDFLRSMVEEMASWGGPPVNLDTPVWVAFADQVATNIQRDDHVYFLAEVEKPSKTVVGLVGANIVYVEDIFEGKKQLHVSAVQVTPAVRRQGIGRLLVESALKWGQHRGCEKAELNVLVGNPARKLYEAMGFKPFEIMMIKGL